jgi:hypothetical protein
MVRRVVKAQERMARWGSRMRFEETGSDSIEEIVRTTMEMRSVTRHLYCSAMENVYAV